jgi:pyruvate/2-oxoglutarate dehydrogenase complex dihydrolipoamide acyltransferase (E2) component
MADRKVTAPFAGTVIAIAKTADEPVTRGAALIVLEAMKMEHEILAEVAGVVRRVEVAVGDTVTEGQLLAVMEPGAAAAEPGHENGKSDGEGPRRDLEAVIERHAIGLDEARPDAVAKRHELGRRTARENLADLVDEGTFVEYGALIFAATAGRSSRCPMTTPCSRAPRGCATT